jgi:hypothetical protein
VVEKILPAGLCPGSWGLTWKDWAGVTCRAIPKGAQRSVMLHEFQKKKKKKLQPANTLGEKLVLEPAKLTGVRLILAGSL